MRASHVQSVTISKPSISTTVLLTPFIPHPLLILHLSCKVSILDLQELVSVQLPRLPQVLIQLVGGRAHRSAFIALPPQVTWIRDLLAHTLRNICPSQLNFCQDSVDRQAGGKADRTSGCHYCVKIQHGSSPIVSRDNLSPSPHDSHICSCRFSNSICLQDASTWKLRVTPDIALNLFLQTLLSPPAHQP